jgi:hypothetical protein
MNVADFLVHYLHISQHINNNYEYLQTYIPMF